MTHDKYDLVILGGGISGYSAAIRATQLGKKVAIVEKSHLGGTCLHKGCIPTKSFLKSADTYQLIQHAEHYGISASKPTFDFPKVQLRKQRIVDAMYQGLQKLIKQKNIDIFHGEGRLLGPSIFSPQSGTVAVTYEDGQSDLIPNDYVLIATGSSPITLPFLPIDHERIVTSDDILSMTALPKSIAIIGAGIIGLEFASFFSQIGVQVHIIESEDDIVINDSQAVTERLLTSLTKNGVVFHKGIALNDQNTTVTQTEIEFELDESFTTEMALVAIGRRANIEHIGLNNTEVEITEQQTIQTNPYMQTKASHIYASGDVIGQLQLAHVGAKEGVIAVEHMFQQDPLPIDYSNMPKCIYSSPEIASIGLTIKSAKEKGYQVKSVKAAFNTNGKALIMSPDIPDGFAELIVDRSNGSILGANLVGQNVTEQINELSVLQFLNGSALELGMATHAHPSMSELLMEMGLKYENQSIHL
ncbi:dihydrolipoyl dehydrogenase [Staphylococcus muscae]|uniref:Dihydrolipoyl dehydrogenase n=1 Tax=Staphylococcus muscae TaxID=1294 RepID=A0A240C5I9_9STAP|nr:dihydrolipoyl dehydrogenase [Staphylococcus muscae]AVQ33110.1 dihydrolipoyl dehydrogenase [Staphylococcus muscae]PNZ04751.1 dihydrolipoyl dehydrogenase [Staphylococcus muscae]GGA88295.1 dihydrolipoyl dehydrogenase [Staphylococcus muscae]SNW02553.1 dihydrolipoyl dehydrogenase [Staphylococcus muscae]